MDSIWYIVYAVSFLLLIPSLVLGYIAQRKTANVYNKFFNIKSFCNVKVHEFALILLAKAEIKDVELVQINAKYTNCYDAKNKIFRLSDSRINSISLLSLGLCAHEIGHAIQHNKKMKYFSFRAILLPFINFFAKAFIPIIIISSFLSFTLHLQSFGLFTLWTGNILYAISFIFYLATFPLEFNATKKVIDYISECDFLVEEEIEIIKKVLKVSIWKYILSLSSSLLFFINFISYSNIFDKN